MKATGTTLVLLVAVLLFSTSQAFFVPSSTSLSHPKPCLDMASENEEYFPETAFGAEVVPEGQRPVNEYLDMKRAPLFSWASNEVGIDGLLARLGIIYAVVFATV
jgi:hypothetical protein